MPLSTDFSFEVHKKSGRFGCREKAVDTLEQVHAAVEKVHVITMHVIQREKRQQVPSARNTIPNIRESKFHTAFSLIKSF